MPEYDAQASMQCARYNMICIQNIILNIHVYTLYKIQCCMYIQYNYFVDNYLGVPNVKCTAVCYVDNAQQPGEQHDPAVSLERNIMLVKSSGNCTAKCYFETHIEYIVVHYYVIQQASNDLFYTKFSFRAFQQS